MGIEYKGNKKIAIIHDYLYTPGGAEKVLESLLELFPESELYTSFYDKSYPSENIKNRYINGRVHTSILDKLPKSKLLTRIYRRLSFFVFKSFKLSNYDIIFLSSSGPATWIKKSKNQKVIAFYHKIPSFEFLGLNDEIKERSPELVANALKNGEIMLGNTRTSLEFIDKYFNRVNRKYIDQIDILISNSIHYSKNFRILYGKSPKIVYPPIDEVTLLNISKLKNTENTSQYYVYLGRLETYKGIEYIIDACIRTNKKLKVIGSGSLKDKLPKHPLIEYLGFTDEKTKYEILANAKALINGSREDFGIVYLDALCSGIPIIAFGEGGVLEIATPSRNAIFFSTQDAKSLMNAIARFEESDIKISEEERVRVIMKFGKERFKKEILDIIDSI